MALPATVLTRLPRVVPLDEAARMAGLDRGDLEKMVQSKQVLAFTNADGQVLIPVDARGHPMTTMLPQTPETLPDTTPPEPDINERLRQIKREDFRHLDGVMITLTEASQEFGIPRGTLRDWLYRGYIRGQGKYPIRVNKADVAYCAAIYRIRKQFNSRAPLLDEKGAPYLLKEPELARLRRLAKAQ